MRELLRNLSALAAALLFLTPSLASALEFVSNFDDFSTNWLLEDGSEVIENADSIILSAAPVSPKERGRILIRPILATTPEEIATLTFIVDAPQVSVPFAARAFYYDENRNYLGSDPLFGTLEAGRVVALGSVLNPSTDVRGLRVRLYSNAPTGSITLDRLQIAAAFLPVPEPTTTLLMGLGLAGLASVRPRTA